MQPRRPQKNSPKSPTLQRKERKKQQGQTKAFLAFSLKEEEKKLNNTLGEIIYLRYKFKEKGVTGQRQPAARLRVYHLLNISTYILTDDKYIWEKKQAETG